MKHKLKFSLRQIIESQGVREVAVALGISEDYVRKIRRRKREVSGGVLARACQVYGDTFDATATVREYRSVASK